MGRIKDWNRLLERMEESGDFEAVLSEASGEENEGDEEYVMPCKTGETDFQGFGGMGAEDRKGHKNERILNKNFRGDEKRTKMTARESIRMAFEAFESEEARLNAEYETRLLYENAYGALSGSEEEIYLPREAKEALCVSGGALPEAAEPPGAVEWAFECEGLLPDCLTGDLASREEGVRLTEKMRKTILDTTAKREKDTRKQEIRVEMVSGDGGRKEEDMDELIDGMTARLCAMMMKGSDGIYL